MALSGQRALEAVETFRPDVVLLDLGLPKPDAADDARANGHAHALAEWNPIFACVPSQNGLLPLPPQRHSRV